MCALCLYVFLLLFRMYMLFIIDVYVRPWCCFSVFCVICALFCVVLRVSFYLFIYLFSVCGLPGVLVYVLSIMVLVCVVSPMFVFCIIGVVFCVCGCSLFPVCMYFCVAVLCSMFYVFSMS